MQALILAAGKGSRLGKYTKDNTKCMLEVNGKTLLERAIDALLEANVNKLILVLGYKKDNVKKYIKEKGLDKQIEIEYVDNDIYDKTNNIYSLYLAKDYLLKDDTILLESDLIFENKLVKRLVDSEDKDLALVAKYEQWMDGTVTVLDEENTIKYFIEKQDFNFSEIDNYYKTVNIYKFSKEFSENYYIPFIEAYTKCFGHNCYYELVLKVIAGLKNSPLKGLKTEGEIWYEIDDCQDLDIASCLFSKENKSDMYTKRYGGYWRFSNLKDYCYLVNPYFPTKTMKDKMKTFFDELLINYPSGMKTETICASRMFKNVSDEKLLIGNGAAELINTLKYITKGSIGLSIPSFNEYVRCFPNNEIITIDEEKQDYRFDKKILLKTLDKVDNLVLVSPNNPSGDMLSYEDTIEILNKAKKLNKLVIFDESFIDFANESFTLIDDDILDEYPNLIVIKSISKSYGVPGIRLGILATSDLEKIKIIKDNMPVWNINSYAEYFLQIYTLYQKDYLKSCTIIKEERNRFYQELSKLKFFKVYPSEANYFMIKLNQKSAKELSDYLLEKHNILIKVLNGKNGFSKGEYIRIAVKTKEENDYLISSIKEYYND